MDRENGWANHPQRIAQTIKTAFASGSVGVAFEDTSGGPDHPDNPSAQIDEAGL